VRVLQAIWDGGGNTAPQLAIARELVGRGHEVRVLAHACQRPKVEHSGATFAGYRHAPDGDASDPATDLLRDWEAKTPLGAFARTRDRLMYGPAALFARDVIETLEQSPADVVAWDYLLVGAGVGAEHARAPSAAVIHTVYPLPREGVPPFGIGLQPARGVLGRARDAGLRTAFTQLFRPGMKALNAARHGLGLAPAETPFDQVLNADRALVLTSAAFDYDGPTPPNVRFTGAVLDGDSPPWESPWDAGDSRPLVVVSFSTTFMDQQGLTERVLEALGGLPVRVLMTTGPAIDGSRLSVPGNVELRDFVPHAAVLPEASLVVTHGGMGTVHAALAAGVPVVCIPHGRDQEDVAARVVFRRAGVRIGKGASAEKLRRVARETLADAGLKSGAERMAAALREEDGAAQAADELEALAASAAR
jgi:MGT family glycosyltransferase